MIPEWIKRGRYGSREETAPRAVNPKSEIRNSKFEIPSVGKAPYYLLQLRRERGHHVRALVGGGRGNRGLLHGGGDYAEKLDRQRLVLRTAAGHGTSGHPGSCLHHNDEPDHVDDPGGAGPGRARRRSFWPQDLVHHGWGRGNDNERRGALRTHHTTTGRRIPQLVRLSRELLDLDGDLRGCL